MTREELERFAGRKAPTEAERRIAARVVVKAHKALGIPTPQWIQDLANQ